MKCIVHLLFSMFRPSTRRTVPCEEPRWDQLDGAEFSVILPPRPTSLEEAALPKA